MPEFMIAMYEPNTDELPPPEFLTKVMADIELINADLRAKDAWVFAGGLQSPSQSTVLRLENDEVVVTDGPFLELKEHFGGFTVIRVDTLDEALEYGRRMARATTLPTEVRPFRWNQS